MINEKLCELYAQYYGIDYKSKIVLCGVVDEEAYLNSKPRIVIVLKEPHSDDVGWSIPDKLKEQLDKGAIAPKFRYTWNQTGIWAYALHHGFKSYKELNQPQIILDGISSVGMTNLKKTGGGASAIPNQIRDCAKTDLNLWRQELEIMDPELIICGRTYTNVRSNLGLGWNSLLAVVGKTYHYSLWEVNGHNTVVLEFRHPAGRKNRDETLELLRKLMNRLKEIGTVT